MSPPTPTEEGPEPTPGALLGGARARWLLALVLLATFGVMARSLGGEFVYDDLLMVQRNPRITSFAHLGEIFTGAYWDFLAPGEASRIGYWRPLTATALTLGYAVGGGAPWAFHLLSLLCHLGATAAAFSLARRLTGSAPVALGCALLFGLHPVHVESVAWITALNDPLFGLFALLSLDAFVRWRDRGSNGIPLGAALWLVPALLAKELAAAVVPVALALDLGRRGARDGGLAERTRPLLRAYLPLVGVGLLYYLARVAVFDSLAAGLDRTTSDLGFGVWRESLLRLEIVGGAIGLLALPLELELFREVQPDAGLGSPQVVSALVWSLVWAGLLAWALARRGRIAIAALLSIPAGVLPLLIRIESLGQYPLSDRFLYLPVFGAALLISWVAFGRLGARSATALLVLVSVGYGAGSWTRIGDWSDELSLFRASAEQTEKSPYVQWGLGRVLLQEFRESQDPDDLAAAAEAYETALDLLEAASTDPSIFRTEHDHLQANIGLGWCYLYRTQFDEFRDYGIAKALFEQVLDELLALEERVVQARRAGHEVREPNLPVEQAFDSLGAALAAMGDHAGAESAFDKALQRNPDYPEAHHNLGALLWQRGEFARARHHFERSLELRPQRVDDMVWIAKCLVGQGWTEQARRRATEAHEAGPDHPEPMVLLSNIAALDGDLPLAHDWLDRVLEAHPDHGVAWYERAGVYLRMKRHEDAIVALKRACELLAEDFLAHYNLAMILAESGAGQAALPYLQRAYDIGTSDRALVPRMQLLLADAHRGEIEYAYAMASLDRGRGDSASSAWWLRLILEVRPEHGPALALRAEIEWEEGAQSKAIDSLRAACEAAPRYFKAHYDLGLKLKELGGGLEALETLRRARELAPPTSWPDSLREQILSRIDKAIDELERVQGPLPVAPG